VAFVFAAAGVDRRDATQVSEGRFIAEPFGVVAGGDEEAGGDVVADPR
jgi:hypothetical protein